jgi:hypothetical protein
MIELGSPQYVMQADRKMRRRRAQRTSEAYGAAGRGARREPRSVGAALDAFVEYVTAPATWSP